MVYNDAELVRLIRQYLENRNITRCRYREFDLQYAHRFYGFKGEAQYLRGYTGVLTIEVEDTVNEGVNMVFPCNEIQKTAWNELKNFDHALILREDDPLLPAVSDVYEKQGIKNGLSQNMMKGEVFKTELATAYPDNNIDRCPLYGISLNEEYVPSAAIVKIIQWSRSNIPTGSIRLTEETNHSLAVRRFFFNHR